MLRPGRPHRQSHSRGNMAVSCRTWRSKSSKRRAEVKPTSSLPARLLSTPAQQSSKALWLPPTTFYWGRHLYHPHSSYCRGPSPVEELPASAVPPTPVPKQSPRPKRWDPSPDPVESMSLGGTISTATLGGPPAPSGKRSCPGTEHSSQAMLRHLAETLTWLRRPGGNFSQDIPTTSSWKGTAISQRYLSRWPWAPNYWTLLSTKSRHHGWDLTNWNKQNM